MNRQFLREEIQKILQRWHQLRQQFGDQAINVPEFTHLSKIIKYLQQQNQQSLQRKSAPQDQSQPQAQQQIPQQQQQQFQSLPHIAQPINNSSNGTPSVPNAMMGQVPGNMGGNTQRTIPQQQFQPPQQSSYTPQTQTPQVVPQQQMPFQNGGPMNSNNIPPTMRNTVNTSAESAFSAQQVQMLKVQFQAFKFLLKSPGPSSPLIPQNVIDFVTNDRLAFANGNYLPSTGHQPAINTQTPQFAQLQIPGQSRQPSQTQGSIGPNSQSPMIPMQQNIPQVNNQMPPNSIPFSALQEDLLNGLKKQNKRGPKPKMLNQGINSNTVSISNQSPVQIPKRQASIKSTTKDRSLTPSTTNTFNPVCLDPKPPVSIDDLVPDKATTTKTIVPITKPNVQVDCFEVPDILSDKFKDIPYTALYTVQSRFQIPGLLPEGIDMDDIINNREALIILQIDQKITYLRKQLDKSNNEDESNEIKAEISKLELLPYQKELRGKILSQAWFSKSLLPNSHPNFLAKFNNLSSDNVTLTHELYKQQLHSLVQAQNKKHQSTIKEILSAKVMRNKKQFSKKEKIERFANKISSFHSQTAKEEQKKLEKMAKQRLQALKLNDEEAYLKLLDHTKDTRITHLLKQTNQFLDSLAQAVETQQRESHNKSQRTVPEENVEGSNDEERREKMDYYHVAHRIKEEVTKQPSILVGGTLKEYQIKGLQWMVSLFNNHLNGILADEMGLGKTIQTISLLTYLIEIKKIPGPFLVIVPLSTLTNWNIEFEKWAPGVKKVTYKGTPTQRKVLQHDIKLGNFQILLTTFEYIIKDRNLLSKVKWVHMIIDEGHRMKNANSKLSETLTHHYHSDYRLILTGTPLQNNLPELWALLNFVLPKIFNSVKSFDEWFNTPFANTGGQDKIELSEEETLLVIRRLHKVLRPFLLRRLKKDVEKDLPNKVEKVVKCKMSSLQSKLYQQMLKHNILYASKPGEGDKPVLIKNANNQIMQLRKICNHPFVYEEVENLINPTSETNDQIWRVAGKFELLDKVLPKFKNSGHRVLIFFQMTQIMDIMEDFLRLRGMKYMRLDGGTKADDRTGLLKLFNAPDSDYFCFLLSTRAGGLGLNLQTADTVIIFDTDWNPHQDLQAQDRAHRIGQKNEVRILRLITEDSVEEMILERAHAKLEIDGKVIQAGKFDNKSTSEEQEALLRALLEKEDERKQKGNVDDNDDLDDDELNQVIARNDDELIAFRKLDEARSLATKEANYPSRLFSDQELPEIYQKDPETILKKDEVIEEYGRGNRERRTALYDDNLTEEQWLKTIEGVVSDDSDGERDFKPKRARGRPRGMPRSNDDTDMDENADLRSQTGSVSSKKRKAFIDDDLSDDSSTKRQRQGTPKAYGARGRGRGRGRGGRGKGSLLYRATPTVDPLTTEERQMLQGNMISIYDSIINHTGDQGRKLSDLFLLKPSKKLYPDYYVLIKHPIALDMIKKRIQSKSYTGIREILEDLHLMFSNAKIYNEEGSIVYQDAAALEDLAVKKFEELYSDLEPEEMKKTLDFTDFDEIFNLKPLTSNSAVKQPVERKLEELDGDESFESPMSISGADGLSLDETPLDLN
ncbi:uncharacterized protein AC631_01780 [Debaryomyces fabryi]|uniref:Transcription regulatory protein SNF2 n=1 Tax=Debaryomyces fabryi TaxID=58627 RepID=A0A0V1Q1W1_9ASCO|nr:uncharacterized protein AC631_01780 [Debaryomyces fabryi]KSA02507.1 hypothetical protein AC631_01780 [Debaryomyces fabryi]CUM50424.1 unnamed protein product [Debaryomyces fabryi]